MRCVRLVADADAVAANKGAEAAVARADPLTLAAARDSALIALVAFVALVALIALVALVTFVALIALVALVATLIALILSLIHISEPTRPY